MDSEACGVAGARAQVGGRGERLPGAGRLSAPQTGSKWGLLAGKVTGVRGRRDTHSKVYVGPLPAGRPSQEADGPAPVRLAGSWQHRAVPTGVGPAGASGPSFFPAAFLTLQARGQALWWSLSSGPLEPEPVLRPSGPESTGFALQDSH